MANSEFGELIPRDRATNVINKRINLMEGLKQKTVPMFAAEEADFTKNEELSFTDNNYNGFVFSKSLIDEFFTFKMPDGKAPNCLLVALGAELDTTTNRMLPTVIIAPCAAERDAVTGELKVTGADNLNPAAETPPKIVLVDGFPFAPGEAIRFTVK